LVSVYVLDSSALIAFLRGEAGSGVVESHLHQTADVCISHALNVCEVYYDALRHGTASEANEMIDSLLEEGLQIREDLDRTFWSDVGQIKVNPGRMSLADSVCIALARREKCKLLTADHHEMDRLVGTGLLDISFIR
jgi:PIN domain nuclease of toxin-antitoxin system